jgi:hypothetical protein
MFNLKFRKLYSSLSGRYYFISLPVSNSKFQAANEDFNLAALA